MVRPLDIVGRTYGTYIVASRYPENTAAGKARFLCRCSCGTERVIVGSELAHGRQKTCISAAHRSHPSTVCYGTAHQRVSWSRGSAATYPCFDCGGPAADWSYDHEDPNELRSRYPATLGYPYSIDPAHYQPRCRPCHTSFDLRRGI